MIRRIRTARQARRCRTIALGVQEQVEWVMSGPGRSYSRSFRLPSGCVVTRIWQTTTDDGEFQIHHYV